MPSKPKSPHHPTLILSHQWPSWTKIYVEERKTKKKNGKTKERGQMCSNVLQPSPPYISLSPPLIKTMFPELPFCKPPKNSLFIIGPSKEQYFSPSYVGFLGSFVFLTEKTGKRQPSYHLTSSCTYSRSYGHGR